MSSRAIYRILQQIVLISGFCIFSGCDPAAEKNAVAPESPGTSTPPAASSPGETAEVSGSGTEASKTETPPGAGTKEPPAGTKEPAKGQPTVQLASGVSYTVLRQGTGEPVQKNHRVQIHYRGWIADQALERRIFRDTRRGGVPETYRLSADPLTGRALPQSLASGPESPAESLIPGLYEGILGMKKGEWRRIFVPSTLGYGTRGFPAVIPRRTDLHFEVELVDFSAK